MLRLDRSIQYPRGLTIQSLLSLEYWIAKSLSKGREPGDDTEWLFENRI
jgi:hypothetical protein